MKDKDFDMSLATSIIRDVFPNKNYTQDVWDVEVALEDGMLYANVDEGKLCLTFSNSLGIRNISFELSDPQLLDKVRSIAE